MASMLLMLSRNFRQSQGRFRSLFLWKIHEAGLGKMFRESSGWHFKLECCLKVVHNGTIQ